MQPSKATGQSPFFLTYGSEAILSTDIMGKSPRVEAYQEGEADEARQLELDLVEEVRINALTQSARYLQGVRPYHDRNVQQRSFNVGDLVLRRTQDETELHKLNSRWEGPFIVWSQDQNHTELLMQMETRYPIPRILNTCVDFILDPSSMVMSVDLFNKERVFISYSITLKAIFNLAASPLATLQKIFSTRIISTDSY